ncbi:PKD domain protein [compost metagenome]
MIRTMSFISVFNSLSRYSALTKYTLAAISLCFSASISAQVTVGFQGGEAGDLWGFTSTGASTIALNEALLNPNKVTGTQSLVVGGNTGGGNCFAGGSGNGPSTPRTFTFDDLDISSSNAFVRTLTFSWGTRFPNCNGPGYDSGENLVFTAYHDGAAQGSVTLATGYSDMGFNIKTNAYTWTIPACVSEFHFVISVSTNRSDEYLFLDNVRVTSPQLNSTFATNPVAGNTSVCVGATETYSVTPVTGILYTWSGLPSTASFTTPNGTNASASMTVNWGTTPPGTYTFTVTPSNSCGFTGTPQTVTVTIVPAPTPVTISGPTSMCPGETITLTSSFPTGNSWTPNSETTQSITVTTAQTYTVSNTTSCGTVTASHTVTLNPVPTIQSVTNNPVSCFGTTDGSIVIVSPDSNLEYSLDGTTWQSSNTFGNLAPGSYTPRVRFVGGCSVAGTPVQITEPAVVTASASNAGPYCEGEMSSLAGSTTSAGTPSFSWSGPNGYTSTAQNPSIPALAGTHTYQLIVTINGCQSNSASTTVIVHALPVANAANSGPYCTGAPIQLIGTTTSTGTVTYSWSGPNGYTSTVQNPSNATAAGSYSLIITENGCQSAPATTTVVINPIPLAQASYTAPFCTGTVLQLNGSTPSAGTADYSWSGPNGYTSALQNPADGTAAGLYSLVVTISGCSSLPASINVISEIPSLVVSNTGPYCEDETVQLNGSTNSTETVSYSWTGPNGYTSSLQNPTDATNGGIYTLTIHVNNCSNIASTVVTVRPNPVAGFSSNAPCANDSTVFLSTSSVPSPEVITSWLWDFNDGTVSAEEHPRHLFTSSGTHAVYLKVTTASNCSATTSRDIEVKPEVNANFSFTPNSISAMDPKVQFLNTSTNATSYLWDFDFEGQQSTETSPEFTFPTYVGAYSVKLVAYNDEGCKDSIIRIISIQDEMVYYVPNAFTPDGDEFNQVFRPVFTSGFDPQNYTMLIFNRWGETVFESHDSDFGWDGTYQGTMVPDGTYSWNIRVKQFHSDAFESISGHVSLIR